MVQTKEDLTGKRFGMLTVIKQVEDYVAPRGRHYDRWLCQCDCGNTISVVGYHLKEKNKMKSCGCYSRKILPIIHAKENVYDLESKEYGIGYTDKGEEFWFDKEDYDLIKNYYWRYNNNGYVYTLEKGAKKYILLHRLVMDSFNIDNLDVDHKRHPPRNEHKVDNRKENLQFVNDSLNSMNRALRSDNTSGTTGVYWSNRDEKWIADIGIQQKRIRLGAFINFEDAVKARKDAEIKYFKDHRYDANN